MKKETLLKIMTLFRTDIDKGMTILEISKKLKIGYRPAYNHIISMEELEIINFEKIGNSKQCSLNLKNEKCRHLLTEVDMQRKEQIYNNKILKQILKELTLKITEKFISNIHSIILFGSYAKGNARKDSDIDLIFIVSNIRSRRLRKEIERECASYQYSHNTKVSPIITDIKEFKIMLKAKELTVGKEARESGVPIYGSEQYWRFISWKE